MQHEDSSFETVLSASIKANRITYSRLFLILWLMLICFSPLSGAKGARDKPVRQGRGRPNTIKSVISLVVAAAASIPLTHYWQKEGDQGRERVTSCR